MSQLTRALIYTRQSQAKAGESEETSLSLQAQRDRIHSYAAREGWQVVDEIADHDLSGERWDRPGLQRLIERVRAGGVDVVVVFSISRLARKVLHQEMVMDVLTEHGAQLVSVTEAGLDNILVRVVHAGMAEQHNVNHRKILRASLETKARRGQHHGRPPFGYRVAEGKGHRLVIEPAEAEIVRTAYAMRADGMSARHIAEQLNRQAGPGDRRWHPGTVIKMLRRPTYAGYAVYQDEIVGDLADGVLDPIIDRDLWHQVQRNYSAGRRAPRNPGYRRSWLEGLVRHACGAGMSPGGVRREDRPFRCNRSRHIPTDRCTISPSSIAMRALEQAVEYCVLTDLRERPMSAAELVRLRSQALGMPDAIKRRGQLMKQKTTLIEQIRRAEQLVTTGRRDLDWFDAFDREAQAKLEALDTELAQLLVIPTEDDYAVRLASLDRLMPALPAGSIPTELLRTLVSALGHVVFDGTVRIEYAPEYRDCFPYPVQVRANGRRTTDGWGWQIERCG